MAKSIGAAAKRLQQELSDLKKQKPAGFTVEVDDKNMFLWNITIFGPPDTLYQGGYFKGVMEFPTDYPYNPPKFKFLTKMWHPNIYFDSGEVCISILHSPVPDSSSGEKAEERWRPTQEARTIILSVISLFTCPNTSSPANVDASVAYRKWLEHKDPQYAVTVKSQVEKSRQEAAKDNVTVPTNVDDYLREERSSIVKEEEMEFDFGDQFTDEDYDDDSSCGPLSSDQSSVGAPDQDSGNEGDEEMVAGTPTATTGANCPPNIHHKFPPAPSHLGPGANQPSPSTSAATPKAHSHMQTAAGPSTGTYL